MSCSIISNKDITQQVVAEIIVKEERVKDEKAGEWSEEREDTFL